MFIDLSDGLSEYIFSNCTLAEAPKPVKFSFVFLLDAIIEDPLKTDLMALHLIKRYIKMTNKTTMEIEIPTISPVESFESLEGC